MLPTLVLICVQHLHDGSIDATDYSIYKAFSDKNLSDAIYG